MLHDRNPTGVMCPCGCESIDAIQVGEEDDLHLLIDTKRKRRWLRHEVEDAAGFDKLAASPDTLRLTAPIRFWEGQRDAIFDIWALLHMLTGGARVGKTTGGQAAFFRRWMLWGGHQAVGFMLAPKMPKTRMLLRKFLLGEKIGDRFNKPICPLHNGKPVLATKWPRNHRQEDQDIYMIDGSHIRLSHMTSVEADNIVGEAVFGVYITEIGQCKYPAYLNESKARVIDTGRQVFLDTIPIKGHPFLVDEVIRPAEAEAALIAEGRPRDGRRLNWVHRLRTSDNPWVPEQAAKDYLDSIKDPIVRRRLEAGDWIGDHNKIWENVWEPSRHVQHFADYSLPKGYRDITKQACRPWFRRSEDWIIGVDINKRPSTCEIAKIFGDPDDPNTWGIFIMDELRIFFGGSDPRKVARDLANHRDGIYRGACVSIDAAAAQKNQNKVFGYRSSVTPAEMFRREGFDCKGCFRSASDMRHPSIIDSQNVLRELMSADDPAKDEKERRIRFRINGARCEGLSHAFEYQEDRGDGHPVKASNAYSDVEIAGRTDATRYLAWPIFYRILFKKKIKFREQR